METGISAKLIIIITVLSAFVFLKPLAERDAFVFIDISGKSNRTKLLAHLDTIHSQSLRKTDSYIVFLSQAGSSPLIHTSIDTIGQTLTELTRTIKERQRMSLPLPAKDLDTILKLTDSILPMNNNVELYFFFGYDQIAGNENHVEMILERFLFTHGLFQRQGRLNRTTRIKVYVDTGGRCKGKENQTFLEDYNKLINHYPQYEFICY